MRVSFLHHHCVCVCIYIYVCICVLFCVLIPCSLLSFSGKYGKRKYHKGHKVEGNWVFGMIERLWDVNKSKYKAGKAICVVVQARDERTLKEIIVKHVRKGSIVHSDLWKAYNNVGYYTDDGIVPYYSKHLTVNHKKNYKDPVTGCHTNTIEGHWRVSKSAIPKRIYADAELLQGYLFKQVWTTMFRNNIWVGLLQTLKEIRYNAEERILMLYGVINHITGEREFIGWAWREKEEEAQCHQSSSRRSAPRSPPRRSRSSPPQARAKRQRPLVSIHDEPEGYFYDSSDAEQVNDCDKPTHGSYDEAQESTLQYAPHDPYRPLADFFGEPIDVVSSGNIDYCDDYNLAQL